MLDERRPPLQLPGIGEQAASHDDGVGPWGRGVGHGRCRVHFERAS
jgi:hypothetical protein